MKAEQMRQVLDFERNLKVGSQVVVRWTDEHGRYRGRAVVSQIQSKSYVVKLLYGTDRFEQGFAVRVPNFLKNPIAWSQFNRIEPIDGYLAKTK